jgi:restriction system protein
MSFPSQGEIEIPLLRALAECGGSAKPRALYPKVAANFPDLTAAEQEQRLESSPSTRKWWNLVQWVRQALVSAGEIDGSTRGVWTITPRGTARLSDGVQAAPAHTSSPARDLSLRDLANRSRDEAKSRLLTELKALSPTAFEHFCKALLQQLGYREVNVTKRSGDGGIDGYGNFQQGVVSIKSAFQAKRWADAPVGRPEIDRLRGALQGEFDHGVFITTSRFTKDATEASYRKGAISILLLDGDAVVELMLERGLGVAKQPLYLYEVDDEFFDFGDKAE